MRGLAAAVVAVGLLVSLAQAAEIPAPVQPGAPGQRAFDDLGTYYAQGPNKPPPYSQAIAALEDKDPAKRTEAGAYLVALLAQSRADETNGRTEWRRLPFWGGGSENVARNFRETLARELGSRAQGVAALPTATWLLEQERRPESVLAGTEILKKTPGPEATALIGQILKRPHPMPEVLVGLIQEAGKRGSKELAPTIEKLCTSPLTQVREAAIAAAPQVGLEKIPPYDPVEAFTPDLDRLLRDIAAMVLPTIPEQAPYGQARVTIPPRQEGDEPRKRELTGWLVGQSETAYRLVTYWGEEVSLEKKQTVLEDWSLAQEAQRLITTRQEMGKPSDRHFDASLSRRGGLTGQFEVRALSQPEAVVAAWCYVRGDKKNAAAVLFPRLDALRDQRWPREIVRDLLGHAYHQEILRIFSFERDYPETLRYARHLAKPLFEDYEYQARARELAGQLEKRTEDFKTFVLPTPEDWDKQKNALSRTQQIEYLAPRLRLLNCFQWGQPGGVNLEDAQTREPHGQRRWDPEPKTTPVVNPLVELGKMKLTVAELPTLVPYLADENYLPTFSYWRDFHPSRYMYRVNGLVAELIDGTAKRPLAELSVYRELDAAGRKQHLERILAWCQTNRDRSAESLLLDSVENAKDYGVMAGAAEELLETKHAKLLGLLLRRLPDFPDRHAEMIELCYKLDTPEAVPPARQWLKSETDHTALLYAALILIKHGSKDQAEGLTEVKTKVLNADDGSYLYPRAVEPLLATGRPEALEVAAGILKKDRFWDNYGRARILQLLILRGREDACNEVLKRLDDTTSGGSVSGTRNGKRVDQPLVAGDRMADDMRYWCKPSFVYDSLAPAEERTARRAELKKWLQEQFALIKAGKPSTMLVPEGAPYFPTAHIDAPP